jgi:hypothetical protein
MGIRIQEFEEMRVQRRIRIQGLQNAYPMRIWIRNPEKSQLVVINSVSAGLILAYNSQKTPKRPISILIQPLVVKKIQASLKQKSFKKRFVFMN